MVDEKTGCESLQLCVPQHSKEDLLQELHDLCGHLSVLKTTVNVGKCFYWLGNTADIELYCQTCHTCGSRNGPIPRPRAPMQSIKTGYPLERIQIDILGPLPETNRGNKYVNVVVDMYTKWPEAYALPNQEADTVAQAVMDNFVCRFGCPRGVLSLLSNFESRLFRGLCDLIESVKQRTTAYHPQCDGGAEWLICTVTSVISKIAQEQEEWDQHLPKILLALDVNTVKSWQFGMVGGEGHSTVGTPEILPSLVRILAGCQGHIGCHLQNTVCTLTILNRTAQDPFNFNRHCTMSRRTETCLQI